jgi:hypothetical protein
MGKALRALALVMVAGCGHGRSNGRSEPSESREQTPARPGALCQPMPVRRPDDFSVLRELWSALPDEPVSHTFSRVVAEGTACRDDGDGPAFYLDGDGPTCMYASPTTLDRLYATIRSRRFVALRPAELPALGPRHVAMRIVVRYQGKLCERMVSFQRTLESDDIPDFLALLDAIKASIKEMSAP